MSTWEEAQEAKAHSAAERVEGSRLTLAQMRAIPASVKGKYSDAQRYQQLRRRGLVYGDWTFAYNETPVAPGLLSGAVADAFVDADIERWKDRGIEPVESVKPPVRPTQE